MAEKQVPLELARRLRDSQQRFESAATSLRGIRGMPSEATARAYATEYVRARRAHHAVIRECEEALGLEPDGSLE